MREIYRNSILFCSFLCLTNMLAFLDPWSRTSVFFPAVLKVDLVGKKDHSRENMFIIQWEIDVTFLSFAKCFLDQIPFTYTSFFYWWFSSSSSASSLLPGSCCYLAFVNGNAPLYWLRRFAFAFCSMLFLPSVPRGLL